MRKKFLSVAAACIIATGFASSASAATHEVKSGDSLWKIAKQYGITVDKLIQLNHITGEKIFLNQVLVVDDKKKPSTPAVPTAKPDAGPTTYVVKKGDNLSKIATALKVTVAQLKQWNHLKSDALNAGQHLSIHTQAEKPAKAPVIKPAAVDKHTVHIAAAGDSLAKIAAKYNVALQDIKLWNGLSSDLIYAGQALQIGMPPFVKDSNLLETATQLLGTPYLWAGTTPDGFDCSGFIYYAFKASGHAIKRLGTDGYYDRSHYITNPEPGNLVFFENTYKQGISHMGIYLGNGNFIHADSNGVEIANVEQSYWKTRLNGYKKFY